MLRGRRSCAISERPTLSPFVSPSLSHRLTLLFPLHPRNSPVTPLFPLLTQKQGGGAPINLRLIFALITFYVPRSNAGDSNRSLQERTASEGVPYTNSKPVPQKPPFIGELIEYVGAPTSLISAPPLFSASLCLLRASALSFSFFVPDFQLSTFNFRHVLSLPSVPLLVTSHSPLATESAHFLMRAETMKMSARRHFRERGHDISCPYARKTPPRVKLPLKEGSIFDEFANGEALPHDISQARHSGEWRSSEICGENLRMHAAQKNRAANLVVDRPIGEASGETYGWYHTEVCAELLLLSWT